MVGVSSVAAVAIAEAAAAVEAAVEEVTVEISPAVDVEEAPMEEEEEVTTVEATVDEADFVAATGVVSVAATEVVSVAATEVAFVEVAREVAEEASSLLKSLAMVPLHRLMPKSSSSKTKWSKAVYPQL